MVRVKEKQLGGITVLDKDGYSVVTNSGSRLADVADPINLKDAVNKEYADSLAMSGGPHASTHESGGMDQIDGYQLSLTYTPVNYTAPGSNILGLHIKRIDDALGTFGEGTGDFLANGTVSMTGNFNAGGNNIINVNLVDGYDIPNLATSITSISNLLNDHSSRHQNGGADEIDVTGLSGLLADAQNPITHASRHVSGGTDPIDGYQLAVAYSPVNYNTPSSNILGQHLKRIDDALGSIPEGGSGSELGIEQVSISVTIDNQTAFTLPSEPFADGYVQMFVNGIKQQYGTDYTGVGTSVTYLGTPDLTTDDDVEFWYLTVPVNGPLGSQTLAQTLALGSATGGYNVNLTGGSKIVSTDGTVTIDDDGYVSGNLIVGGPGQFSSTDGKTTLIVATSNVVATGSIGNTSSATYTGPTVANNVIARVTWMVAIDNEEYDLYVIYKRDGSGVLSILRENLAFEAPSGVVIEADITSGPNIKVTNNSGGSITHQSTTYSYVMRKV